MQYDSKLRLVIPMLFVLLVLSGCMPAGASQHAAAASVAGAPIHLVDAPTDTQIPSHLSERRQVLHALFAAAALNQTVYGRYDSILLDWPADLDVQGELTIRIQTPAGRIYLERMFTAGPSATARLGKAYVLPAADYHVVLMPALGEYYLEGMRIERKIAMRTEAAPS